MLQLSVGEDYRFVTYDLNIAVDNVTDNGCTVVYMDNILPLWINDYLARAYNNKDLPFEDIAPSDYKKYDDEGNGENADNDSTDEKQAQVIPAEQTHDVPRVGAMNLAQGHFLLSAT